MYQLKIALNEITPEIWRRILVSENITLYKLHHIIQETFGWTNSHLYYFGEDPHKIGDVHLWNDGETQPDSVIKVKDVLKRENDTLSYIYDIGDFWQHTILLEKIHPSMKTQRKCIGGERQCPPEDCGGIRGYYQVLEVLKNPGTDEYREMVTWLDGKTDPEFIDIRMINAHLGLLSEYIREYEEGE
jgi:hypothetical protein